MKKREEKGKEKDRCVWCYLFLLSVMVAAALCLPLQASAADIISLFGPAPFPNIASDENREYLIDRSSPTAANPTGPVFPIVGFVGNVPIVNDGVGIVLGIQGNIDIGDSLRAHFSYNTLNSIGANVGGTTGNNEWTGVFQVLVVDKVEVVAGIFNFTFGPDPAFEADLGGGQTVVPVGFVPGPGAMMLYFEDPSNNYASDFDDPAPATPPVGPDDGAAPQAVPPSSEDVGTGPYVSEEAFIALARDGGHFWTLGFAGRPGEGWMAQSAGIFGFGNNILSFFNATSGSALANFNAGLTRLFNGNPGIADGIVVPPATPSAFGGTVEFAFSGSLRGVSDLDTPFETSSNVNVSFQTFLKPPSSRKNQPGSLLVFPLIDNEGFSTIIEIANTDLGPNDVVLDCEMVTHPLGEPAPPLFSKRDFRITLTPKEVFWWDTGKSIPARGIPNFNNDKGFLFCWAVDGVNTRLDIEHNFLKGDAIVFGNGLAFQYNAIPHQGIAVFSDRVLNLDGFEYTGGTSTVMFEGFVEDFAGINGVLAVAGLDIDFINSIQPTANINFSCWNELEQGSSTDLAFYQFVQYDFGADLNLTIDDVFTPKFHCATSTTIPLWAVTYQWTGGLAWGTNVFQDPNSATPTAVVLPPVVQ